MIFIYSFIHSLIHIRLIEKAVRTQLNIRNTTKQAWQIENSCQATTVQ